MPTGAVDRRIVPLAPGFLSLVVVLGLARRQRRSTLPRSPSRRCSPRRPAIPRWNRDEPPRTLRVVEPRRVPAVRRRVALSSRSVATVCLLVLSDYSGATGTLYLGTYPLPRKCCLAKECCLAALGGCSVHTAAGAAPLGARLPRRAAAPRREVSGKLWVDRQPATSPPPRDAARVHDELCVSRDPCDRGALCAVGKLRPLSRKA